MIQLTNKKSCCGCGACAEACPRKCITMTEDAEGFLYPEVNKKSCVDCGICEKACPILGKKEFGNPEMVQAYAAYAKDSDIRRVSSSGGIFSLLALWVLDQGGVVFGAAFAEDFSVRHVMIECAEDLHRLRGSKYVQSVIGDTFAQAKKQLETGRLVLFSGVACQIAGLIAFLGKEYGNLYTIDVLCHGVPSPRVWKQYLCNNESTANAKVMSVSFRDKELGWKKYQVEIRFENEKIYKEENEKSPYMRVFLSDICLRPSCHDCQFKAIPHPADITLGDAWGIKEILPEMDDDQGTSVVLVNTEKGKRTWQSILPLMTLHQETVDVLLTPNGAARKSVQAHPNRKQFFAAVNQGASFDDLSRMARRTLAQRIWSFGKRCVKKLLAILGIRVPGRR